MRLTQPTVRTHFNLGTLQEVEVSSREEVKPEVGASRLNVVMETSEEGSRVAAGGGHGAAGKQAALLSATPPVSYRATLILLSRKCVIQSTNFNVVM